MEAKVDSMQPQESCGHKIYQDSTLEEKAVSKKHCNTFWEGDLNLPDTIILYDWFRLFFISCLIWFRIDFCLLP